jgi:hypothetical protein
MINFSVTDLSGCDSRRKVHTEGNDVFHFYFTVLCEYVYVYHAKCKDDTVQYARYNKLTQIIKKKIQKIKVCRG